ncbi:MAG: glutathione peroxidase [Actinomycetota bacterium]
MGIHDIKATKNDGTEASLGDFAGKAVLVVNVASKCGLTPQYAGLQALYDTYKDRGLEILGFPCNQFMGQEPGTDEEIAEFCSLNFGVSFPLFSKIEVNGEDQHPLYAELTAHADHKGEAGDVQWNFEKFLISPDGEVVGRFRPQVTPDKPFLVEAIEAQLPG